MSSLYWVTMLSCCSNVFFTSSSFFSSSLDLWTALVIIPVIIIIICKISWNFLSIDNKWIMSGSWELPPTDPPVLWQVWWTRGRTASALEMGKQAAASEPHVNTAHVWWWSPTSLQSFPFQFAFQWAVSASLWGGQIQSAELTQDYTAEGCRAVCLTIKLLFILQVLLKFWLFLAYSLLSAPWKQEWQFQKSPLCFHRS